jgi:hypothetical protein
MKLVQRKLLRPIYPFEALGCPMFLDAAVLNESTQNQLQLALPELERLCLWL